MLFKVSHDMEDRSMFSCALVWCFLMTVLLKAGTDKPCQIRQLDVLGIYAYLLN